jgi:hypothetical protein
MNDSIRRAMPLVSVVALVALLVLGASSLRALTDTVDGSDQRPGPIAAHSAADSANALDLGATTADDVVGCLTPGFSTDPSEVDVLYGVQQRRLGGSNPVLVLRNPAGDIRLCDQFGGDSPSEAPLPTASPEDPVVFLSSGRAEWSCQGTSKVLDHFQKSTWLAVSPDVVTVRQRYWVDGSPGRWFDTQVQHGYAHLQTWVEGPMPAGTKFAEEYRVLDAAGNDVRQTALPTQRTPLPGCTTGGTAQIG